MKRQYLRGALITEFTYETQIERIQDMMEVKFFGQIKEQLEAIFPSVIIEKTGSKLICQK